MAVTTHSASGRRLRALAGGNTSSSPVRLLTFINSPTSNPNTGPTFRHGTRAAKAACTGL